MADSVLKVCQESRMASQVLMKNEYILCASKPSATMKKRFRKCLYSGEKLLQSLL